MLKFETSFNAAFVHPSTELFSMLGALDFHLTFDLTDNKDHLVEIRSRKKSLRIHFKILLISIQVTESTGVKDLRFRSLKRFVMKKRKEKKTHHWVCYTTPREA